jgi:molybdopterin converting factor small subunit
MSLKIIFFGRLAEIGGESIELEQVANTDDLVKALHKNFPELADTRYAIAVDKKVISGNTILYKNSEVALLPPFSGG